MEGNAFCVGVMAPPTAGDFFATALSLARVMPLALSLSISFFRPSAVVGIAGLSMARGSDLGAVDVEEVDGLLGVGLLIDPDMLGIAFTWGAPCYCYQR